MEDGELTCPHTTVTEWTDPRDGSLRLSCPVCSAWLVFTAEELVQATSEKAEFALFYRVAQAFGSTWAHIFWQQTRHGKKRDTSTNSH